MDIQMPGMDGFETARQIRSMDGSYFRDVPIIAMTASTSDSTRHEIFRSGMQDIIQKPVNIDELRARIIEYSNIEEEIPIASLPDEETEKMSIDFSRTDHLFLSNGLRYQEFLRMAIEEFNINLDLLKVAIKNGDQASFRSINHRMKNLLHTFGMDDLLMHLEEIKEKLKEDDLKQKEKRELSKSLTLHVETLLDTMGNKLASLKWQ
jgi:CheY-like chemotaxis protein